MSQKIGSMGTAKSIVTVAGGAVFDSLGSDDAPSNPGTVTLTASLRGNGRVTLETSFRELQALRGKVLKLYRAWDADGGHVEWIYARLEEVNANADYWHNNVIKAVQMKWQLLDNVWNGPSRTGGWTFDSGEYFDTGLDFDNVGYTYHVFYIGAPSQITVRNNGNTTVTGMRITMTGGGVLIGKVSIEKVSGIPAKMILEPDVPYPSLGELIIDTNLSTVEKDGANIYADFRLDAVHKSENWFLLETGDNILQVYATPYTTGGLDGYVTFEFADAYQ